MAPFDGSAVREQVPGWIRETQDSAEAQLAELRAGWNEARDQMADGLAWPGASLEAILDESKQLLGVYRHLLGLLVEHLGDGWVDRLAPLAHAGGTDPRVWSVIHGGRQSLGVYASQAEHYVTGCMEGGCVAVALRVVLPPPHHDNVSACRRAVDEGLEVILTHTEDAIGRWVGDMQGRLEGLVGITVREGRLATLLAQAELLDMDIRNVPPSPSDRYLDELELKLDRKRLDQGREEIARQERQERLKNLLALSDHLGIGPRVVPSDPEDPWLDQMEVRLAQVTLHPQAAEPEPPTIDPAAAVAPPTAWSQTADQAPPRTVVPKGPAGLDLDAGDDDEDWVGDMERRLQDALDQRDQKRQEERKSWSDRLEVLKSRAAAAGIHLGEIPSLPSEDWLLWAEHRLDHPDQAEEIEEIEDGVTEVVQAFLIYEEGTSEEVVWPVGDQEITIGRAIGNAVQIRDDAIVSRRHAVVQLRDDGFHIEDLGSTKGTFVDDEPLSTDRRLQGGEQIRVGDTQFVFRLR